MRSRQISLVTTPGDFSIGDDLTVTDTLHVGVTDNPNATAEGKLSVAAEASFRLSLRVYENADADARADLAYFRARGTAASPTTVLNGDTLGAITFDGYHASSSWAEGAKIDAVVDGARTTYWPTTLRFKTSNATTSFVNRLSIDSAGNIDLRGGQAELATSATDGFTYIPTCNGTPAGTPTSKTGAAPIIADRANNLLYYYAGGAWRQAGSGSGLPDITVDADGATFTSGDSPAAISNEGAATLLTFNLPTAVADLEFWFYCQDADGLKVVAAAGDTIRIGADVSATAGNAETTQVGTVMHFKCLNATEWFCSLHAGTVTLT